MHTVSDPRTLDARHDLRLQVALAGVLLRGLERLDTDALGERERAAVGRLALALAEAVKELRAG